MRLYGVFLVVLVCLCAAFARAQAEEALRWEDCVEEAKAHHPSLAAANAQVLKARAQYHAGYSELLPTFSATIGVDDGARESSGGARSSLGDKSIALSGSQPLFSGFSRVGTIRQRSAALDEAEASFAQTKAAVGFDLRQAFARLIYAQAFIDLAKAIAERRQANVRLVEIRYDAGREHKGSLLRIQASARQAEFDVAQAGRALVVARQELSAALGRKQAEDLAVSGELIAAVPPEADVRAIVEETPTYQIGEAQFRQAKAGVTIAQSGFFPEVSATGSLGRQGTDWPPRNDEWTAGVSVAIPLFTGGSTVFATQAARADRARAESALRRTSDEVTLALRQSLAAFHDAFEEVDVQQQVVEAAQTRAEIARSQYTTGLLSFENWDIIENDLIAAQKNVLAGRRDAMIAQADWERTQGKSPF